MKKVMFVLLLLLIGCLVTLRVINRHPTAQAPASITATTYKKACDVFTLKDAQSVLGQGVTRTPSQTDSNAGQKAVTTCLYSYDPGSFSDLVNASVLLQGSPADQAKQSFEKDRPDNAQVVNGYGDQAYWDPNLGQMHILKGQYWAIISAGSGPLNQRDQDLPKKIADVLAKQL